MLMMSRKLPSVEPPDSRLLFAMISQNAMNYNLCCSKRTQT